MSNSFVQVVFALILLIGISIAATAKSRTPAQPEQMPISFTWKSEYWPKGLRQWSQTAPDTWTEKYEDGTADQQFKVLRRISVDGVCGGVLLVNARKTIEIFIPGSRCSSKWLLFRSIGIYVAMPQWIGQAEIQDAQYAPPKSGKPAPR